MPSPASVPAPVPARDQAVTPAGPPILKAVPRLVDAATLPAAPRRRGRPPRLSRPAIFRAALRLIDAEGGGALTMRRLGADMGVEAMSLYRHVSSKDALLDGIGERLMAEHEIGPDALDWEGAARHFAFQVRAVAQAHPEAFQLVGFRALNTVDALRPVEALLAALRHDGFPADRAVAAFRLLSGFARGFVLSEIAGFTLADGDQGTERLTGDQLPAEDFPAIHDLAEQLGRSADEDFRVGIETIVAGLRQDLAAVKSAEPA
jgi:TetR/AcrR family transcriptional regulator, tetracycline repressor protein